MPVATLTTLNTGVLRRSGGDSGLHAVEVDVEALRGNAARDLMPNDAVLLVVTLASSGHPAARHSGSSYFSCLGVVEAVGKQTQSGSGNTRRSSSSAGPAPGSAADASVPLAAKMARLLVRRPTGGVVGPDGSALYPRLIDAAIAAAVSQRGLKPTPLGVSGAQPVQSAGASSSSSSSSSSSGPAGAAAGSSPRASHSPLVPPAAPSVLLRSLAVSVINLGSVTSSTREFSSLCAIHATPFGQLLASPPLAPPLPDPLPAALSALPQVGSTLSPAFATAVSDRLDASQANAVLRCSTDRSAPGAPRLHLIHGPPGTGKTRTVIHLVAAFLAGSRIIGGRLNVAKLTSASTAGRLPQAAPVQPRPVKPKQSRAEIMAAAREALQRSKRRRDDAEEAAAALDPAAKRRQAAAALLGAQASAVMNAARAAATAANASRLGRASDRVARPGGSTTNKDDDDGLVADSGSSDDVISLADSDATEDGGVDEDVVLLDSSTEQSPPCRRPGTEAATAAAGRVHVRPAAASTGTASPQQLSLLAQRLRGLRASREVDPVLASVRLQAQHELEQEQRTRAGTRPGAAGPRTMEISDADVKSALGRVVRPSTASRAPPPRMLPTRSAQPPRAAPANASRAADASPTFSGRVLVCAPSNAAVDEVLARLSAKQDGKGCIPTRLGGLDTPLVVRLGNEDSIRPDLRCYSLDAQARVLAGESAARLASAAAGAGGGTAISVPGGRASTASGIASVSLARPPAVVMTMRSARAAVLRRAHVVFATLSTAGGSDNTQGLGRAVGSGPGGRQRGGTASSQLAAASAASLRWDAVVIDEACQATEPSVMVAIAAATTTREDGKAAGAPPTVVLVGDPCQLPATLLSKRSSTSGLGRSTFERILAASADGGRTVADVVSPRTPHLAPPAASWRPGGAGGYFLLSTQYRMHPAIRSFPGREFYGDKLRDGIRPEDPFSATASLGPEQALQRMVPWQSFYACDVFAPLRFFDLRPMHPAPSRYENPSEARFVARLVAELLRVAMVAPAKPGSEAPARLDLRRRIGVISPYRKQVTLVQGALRAELDAGGSTSRAHDWVTVSTVDGFQGQEQDVIIISCVRTRRCGGGGGRGDGGGIGFLRDARRLNVALTRARHAVLVVGDAGWLAANDRVWKRLVDDAARRGAIWQAGDCVTFFKGAGMPTDVPNWHGKSVWASMGSRMTGFL